MSQDVGNQTHSWKKGLLLAQSAIIIYGSWIIHVQRQQRGVCPLYLCCSPSKASVQQLWEQDVHVVLIDLAHWSDPARSCFLSRLNVKLSTLHHQKDYNLVLVSTRVFLKSYRKCILKYYFHLFLKGGIKEFHFREHQVSPFWIRKIPDPTLKLRFIRRCFPTTVTYYPNTHHPILIQLILFFFKSPGKKIIHRSTDPYYRHKPESPKELSR